MSPKVRLDLMVNDRTKSLLQDCAREEGVSMSEMVDRLIVEHLAHEHEENEARKAAAEPAMDAILIEDLKYRVSKAIELGRVWSFESYSKHLKDNPDDRGNAILFTPSIWPHYGIIVADCWVDELHSDIISTYGGDARPHIVKTIDAYLSCYEDADGFHIDGLCILPKEGNPTEDDCYDWSSPATWPEGVPEPII